MWLLSCDGDLFGGKRIWLVPGSTHLFGRTTGKPENGERIKFIENKSVSRKHLTITVHPSSPDSSFRVHERGKIEVKDGSKIGTTVNGDTIKQETKILEGCEFTLKLGSYQHLLRLKWQPVVLCHSGGMKTKDAWAQQRPTLEAAGVKMLKEYVSNQTTHAVSKKRNTAPNLQALVQGKYVVHDGFVDALCDALKPKGPEGTSPLEEDFDGKWPKEKNHVPPSGTEPVPRPDSFFAPNPARSDVFSDFIFIFITQSQYDNLLPVITGGSGKAMYFDYEPGVSKMEELVEFVKEAAGQKGSRGFKLSQVNGPGGVVLVKPSSGDGGMLEFVKAAESALRQRPIEQNELLDTILSLNTSGLRQPSQETSQAPSPPADREPTPTPAQIIQRQSQRAISVSGSPPAQDQPAAMEQDPQQLEPQEQQPEPTGRRPHRRYITQSRFKGFDEDFDPSQFSKPAAQSPAPSFEQREASQSPSAQDMDVYEPSRTPRTQQNSRKRPIEQVEEPDEEAMYAELLPGRAAVKKMKAETASRTGSRTEAVAKQVEEHKAKARKKKAKELDVMAEIQKRREKEEEARRKDQESLREAMEGVDLSELRNLAKVEEMEVPVRNRPTRESQGERGERWDPAWNGRKNFKKFRPQGSTQTGPRLPRVIVALEEVPRKGQAIGEEYWLQSSRTSKSKSQSQSQATRSGAGRSQRSAHNDDLEGSMQFRRRIQSSREEDAENARAEAVMADEIAGRPRDETLHAAATQAEPSQTLRSESQRKRPAAAQAGGLAKKARQTRVQTARQVVDLDDDDDDDGLKFRRRRR